MDFRVINGVRIWAPASRDELIQYAFCNDSLLVAVNAEKILHATAATRDITSRNLGYPDGIGAVMALRKKGLEGAIKIPGCELWLDIVRKYYKTKRFYLVGGTAATIEATVVKLRTQFPEIQLAGYRDGYLVTAAERDSLVDDIVLTKPDVVFVAMGSPKQELFMEEVSRRHPAVYQGLGGSFDVYIGAVERAPASWVNLNLEWLYRLVKQPSRIKRQIHLVRFLAWLYLGRI